MIVDANVLIYAVDETSVHHRSAKAWLEDSLNGPARVGLPWVSLIAFQRITTHPRVMSHPLRAAEAWSFVQSWVDAENAWITVPGPRHGDILRRFILDGDVRGNLVTDAHLAALAIEHGVGLCSFDSDFARFADLPWFNPAQG